MSTKPDDSLRTLREHEIERLRSLPQFTKLSDDETGVLLSDRIRRYCDGYQLIAPFDPERLRPAGYDLRVGHYYSIGGETKALNDGMELVIGPYQVAIIETYETLNMPEFLIGRWNVRVARAYQGLLWVGGAQVDPGFRGHLCCPIYNLSTDPVHLGFGADLAMIDFVTTTPYEEGKCKRFDWANRRKLVFPEYTPLSSGIEAEVNKFKRDTKEELRKADETSRQLFHGVQTRIDHFLTLIFTVVAFLFTGLGIVATKGSDQPSFVSSPVWVAGLALYFALRAQDRRYRSDDQADTGKWYARLNPAILAVVFTGVIVGASLFFDAYHAHVSAVEVGRTAEQTSRLEAQMRELRQESDTKLANIQHQISLLQQKQVSQK